MAHVDVFDPAMCCSTGVCGTSVDPALAQFAADLQWLGEQGVEVSRATLSQEPAKFLAAVSVREALSAQGEAALPAILVDGQLASTGRYPGRNEMAAWILPGGMPGTPALVGQALPMAQSGGCCGGGAC